MEMKENLSSILLHQISFAYYNNTIENVNIDIDNRIHYIMLILLLIQLKTNKYKIADFILINLTLNDDIFVQVLSLKVVLKVKIRMT